MSLGFGSWAVVAVMMMWGWKNGCCCPINESSEERSTLRKHKMARSMLEEETMGGKQQEPEQRGGRGR